MRLIYTNGRRVGSDPKGQYVYLWRDDADRYVGRGVNGRWAAHLKVGASDSNQVKSRYFAENAAKLDCYILVEGLRDEGASATIEMAEIVMRRPAGTLLNDKNGSTFYGRAAPGQSTASVSPPWQAVLDMRKKGTSPPMRCCVALVPPCTATPRSRDRREGDTSTSTRHRARSSRSATLCARPR
jgi:hypothetical protein